MGDTLQDGDSPEKNGNTGSGWRGALEKRGGGESVCFGNERHFQISCLRHPFRYYLEIDFEFSSQSYQIKYEQLTDTVNSREMLFEPEFKKMLTKQEKEKIFPIDQTALKKILLRNNEEEQEALNFVKQLFKIKIYDRIHTEIWSPIRVPQVPKGETLLDEDGGNLVGVLHQLSQIQPKFLTDLNSLLKILFDDFSRISFPHNQEGKIFIRWDDKNGHVTNTTQISDGTLKFLCLIAILKNPNPPALIGIDEVDANLHPKMQVILADMIREASQRTQIIATTHNPDFVSMFSPGEIVILQKHKGATEMRRFSDKGALDLWLQDFTTRELWLMGELESRW